MDAVAGAQPYGGPGVETYGERDRDRALRPAVEEDCRGLRPVEARMPAET